MSFGTPKPMASLSSSLLARKGHARPAMRPQGYVSLTPSQDDLGWNDMGEEFAQSHQPVAPVAAVPPSAPIEAPAPEVLRQRDALAEQFTPPAAVPEAYEPEAYEPEPEAEPEFTPEPVAAAPRPAVSKGTLARVAREVGTSKSKAAFTLRLDHDRHLRLRLASAVTNRSAQHLVTEALDAFLESLTDVGTLANQLSARDGRTAS
ncbi:MAG: hypothetical protein ACAH11_15500 [Sphingomonas sp.]|nr:hypothetical protein [Sphingomonas sp.]